MRNKVRLPFGTLYATYEFLERALGVRWYWPGELGRLAPRRADLSVGTVRWEGAPSYDLRFCWYAAHREPKVSGLDSARWWRRMRWGGIGGNPVANHSFNGWEKRFGKAHPEYFALQRNGQRMNRCPSGSHRGQMCLTHPDVLKQTIADKRATFDKWPAFRYSAVMPGDGMGGYFCQCPKCQAAHRPERGARGEHSELVWSLVNNVAAELRKTHPDSFITCCSYASYADPPKGVHFQPNVAVTICDGSFPNRMWKPSVKRDYAARVREWSTLVANVYVWDYWIPRHHKGVYGSPSIIPHTIKEWFLLDRGRVRGHAIELENIDSEGRDLRGWADWMLDAVNVYVAMRLLWNMDTDVDAVLAEMYDKFYGPAGPWVRKFYEEMEARYADPATKGGVEPRWDYQTCWTRTYPKAFVKRVMDYLRKAEKATRGKEPYHARVALTLRGFLPFERESARWSASLERKVANDRIAVPEVAAAPTIDGKLDDACWRKAQAVGSFCDSFNSAELLGPTEARFARKGGVLYVAFRAGMSGGPFKRSLPAASRDRWVWLDESCELFLVHGARKYQFLIGPGDIYADNCHPDMSKKFNFDMFRWNCKGMRCKTVKAKNAWTAEIALPLASLKLPKPTARDPWRVNLCRNHYYPQKGRPKGKVLWQWEQSTWRPTFGSFHNVDRYGKLYFE